MAVMRSVFYTPGNSQKFIEKSATFPVDIVTMDIEDAVPMAEKVGARKIAADGIPVIKASGAEAYIRVNAYDTGMTDDDVRAVVRPGLDGITLAKTSGREDVERIDKTITEVEKEQGMEVGSVKLSLLIETAIGVVNCYEAAIASPRVVSLIFGAVDYCRDMKVTITDEGTEQLYARSRVAVAARAAGKVAIDAPFKNYQDIEAYKSNLLGGVQLGYEGRMIIHPSQVEPANTLYAPSEERVEWAKRIVPIFEEEGIAQGKASIAVDGQMVDTPVYINAKDILARRAEIDEYEAKRK